MDAAPSGSDKKLRPHANYIERADGLPNFWRFRFDLLLNGAGADEGAD